MWGYNLPPLVEIGLTDLPKSGGAMTPPAPPGTTGLYKYTNWKGVAASAVPLDVGDERGLASNMQGSNHR